MWRTAPERAAATARDPRRSRRAATTPAPRVVTRDGEVRSNVISSQGLLHERYGGVVPEVASRRHLELVDAVTADALERAGDRARRRGAGGRHARPGPDRRAAGGAVVGQGAGRRARAAADAGRPPARPRGGQHARPEPIEPPYLCLVASGGHTFLARVDEPCPLRAPGRHARRRRRRGVRQGRAPARPRLSGRARDRPPRADRAIRTRSTSRAPRPGELDFSFSGLKTSLLYRVRDLGEAEAERRRADLAASYQRAIVDALVARVRAGARARAASTGWRSAAAWRPTRSCARAAVARAGRGACGSRRSSSAPTTPR